VSTFAGLVSAQCTGAVVTDYGVFPRDGWGGDVRRSGPTELLVRFRHPGIEVGVHVTCRGGRPGFEVDTHRWGGGGD
jgi:hypothetical protein